MMRTVDTTTLGIPFRRFSHTLQSLEALSWHLLSNSRGKVIHFLPGISAFSKMMRGSLKVFSGAGGSRY